MDPVAVTAHWVAASRARESDRPDALFHDPFAHALLGDEEQSWVDETMASFGDAYIALRTRFFDDELLRATRDRGARQVVILAAGMDVRAYRLDWPAGTRVFEIDRPEVLAYKEGILASQGAAPRAQRKSLGADLTEPWEGLLRGAGFSPADRSAWLVEGLLPYLHEEDVRRLLTTISALSTSGSALALDVTRTDLETSPAFAPFAERMHERGIHWHYACDDPGSLLAGFGWKAQTFTMEDLAARYGRPLPWSPGQEDWMRSLCVGAERQI